MMPLRLLRKLGALAIGMIIACLLIEIGLRVGGRFVRVSPKKEALRIAPGTRYLIVCTGDSHTKGSGAPPGFDYPSQLAALLKKSSPGTTVQVVNLGHGGSNSSEAVDRVRQFLSHSSKEPDLVIFQAGKNNDHNFNQASIITDIHLGDDYRTWARYLLSHSRTYRLSQISKKRLTRLLQDADGSGLLHHEDFLNTEGTAEQELFQQWVSKDIKALYRLTGGKLLLLNYFSSVQWVDRAYKEASKQFGVPMADIQDFGIPWFLIEPNVDEYVSMPDEHPNAKGYGIIAQRVFEAIIKNRLLPLGT